MSVLVEYGSRVRLARGHRLNRVLTPARARVLRWMIDEEEELVVEGICAYVGLHRTHPSVALQLLRHCLIKDSQFHGMGAHYYEATQEAQRVLDDPNYECMIDEALRTGKDVCR